MGSLCPTTPLVSFQVPLWGSSLSCCSGLMDPPLPLPPDLEAFKKLIASSGKRTGGPAQKFIKKMDIPSVELPAAQTCRSALNLAK